MKVSVCCICDASLLDSSDIVLRWCLYALLAGLHFYKMYSLRIDGDDIYLKMPASPVPFKDCMPLVFQVAIKPTPSISAQQQSVSLSTMEQKVLEIKGRHDPCIAPRAVPVIEAAAAIAVFDALLCSNIKE